MGFRTRAVATALVISCALPVAAGAQSTTPPRGPDEGQGPFTKLVIRGVNVIDGSGGTVQGPRDIVIQGNRITEIRSAGTPGLPMQPNRPPRDFDKEIDATGMWVMPGLVDEHVHAEQGGTPLTYAYKLWLAHGVTTVRGVNLTGNAAAVRDKAASEANTIVAPRIINYQRPGAAWPNGSPNTPEKAREWVRWASVNGIDGVKFAGTGVDQDKRILSAMIDEANKLGLGTTMHHSPPVYPEVNAVETGRMGLGTVTHFYGHFESILKSGRTHPFPDDYNYADEQSRWRHVAKVIDYTFEPGSPQWWAYLNEQKANGVTFGPTMSVYEAGRDLMRARTQEWHRTYAMPSIWKFWEPDRENHGSFYYDWTTVRRGVLEALHRALHAARQRLQVDRRARRGRHRRRLHLLALRVRRDPRARADAGGRLHPARGDQRLHAPGRAHVDGAQGDHRPGVRHGPRRADRRPDHHAGEPARELQDALRHRHRAPERRDGPDRARRRHPLDGAQRRRLRRQGAAWPTSPRWCRRKRTRAGAPG